MVDPWRFVDAGDDLVADFLAGTVESVLELGGWIHPAARIVEADGQLGVEFDGDASAGEPLLRIPAEAFIRISRVAWTNSTDALEMDGLLADLEPAELELLILQMALHNSCGKIEWLMRSHPAIAPDLPDDVVDAVRAFRPSFRTSPSTAAGLFWSNRVLRLPTLHSAAPEPVAVPILDLLNHHHSGATGTWTGDAFTVSAATVGAGSECALDYGLDRDAIGMAVVYGFADESSQVAHSAPICVDVDGVGMVQVAARGRSRSGALLPITVESDGDAASVSRVTFGLSPLPALIREICAASSWNEGQATAVVEAIAVANIDVARRLQAVTCLHADVPAATTLGQAASTFAAVIDSR